MAATVLLSALTVLTLWLRETRVTFISFGSCCNYLRGRWCWQDLFNALPPTILVEIFGSEHYASFFISFVDVEQLSPLL